MILLTNDLIRYIRNAKNSNIIFCGLSIRTRYLIDKYNLITKIDYIFDNFSKDKHYLNIPIIKYDELKKIDNKFFVINGNHQKAFYKQLKNLSNKKLIFEFNRKSTSLFFKRGFSFEIEVPNFQSGFGIENRNIFAKYLINELLLFNQKILTIPIKPINEEFLRKRVVKQNSLLFSYHGIGDKDFGKIHYKEGYFFDLITYDDTGYSGWSSLCSDEKEIEKIKQIDIKQAEKDFMRYKGKYIEKNRSKYEQPDIDNVLFPKDFVFIPLQVFTDSVMAKSYFEPMEWFRKTVRFLTKKNINIVIKRHPRCNIKEVETELEKLKNQKNITIYSGSIHQAISKSSAVYTINSGSGFEALFHLKPVVTFGEVDYQSATLNIKDLKELVANPIPALSEEKIIYIKQFLSYYMREKNININSKKSIENFVDSFVLRYLNSLLKDNKI